VAGDDELHTELGARGHRPAHKVPTPLRWGEIDDVQEGDVIIRHDAVTWHVIAAAEASAVLWRGDLPKADRHADASSRPRARNSRPARSMTRCMTVEIAIVWADGRGVVLVDARDAWLAWDGRLVRRVHVGIA